MNKDKVYNQITQLNSRIYKLNDRIYELNANPSLNISELRKTEKAKNKLVKTKEKLLKKIYEEVDNEGFIHDEER